MSKYLLNTSHFSRIRTHGFNKFTPRFISLIKTPAREYQLVDVLAGNNKRQWGFFVFCFFTVTKAAILEKFKRYASLEGSKEQQQQQQKLASVAAVNFGQLAISFRAEHLQTPAPVPSGEMMLGSFMSFEYIHRNNTFTQPGRNDDAVHVYTLNSAGMII